MNSQIDATLIILNDLIAVLKDGENGYRTAILEANDSTLVRVFERYCAQRAEFAAELQARVLALGARVTTHGTLTGGLRRGWFNLRLAIAADEPRAVLAEVEHGEDLTVEAYRDAMNNRNLDEPTLDVICRQYADIKFAHDHIRMLRDDPEYRKAS